MVSIASCTSTDEENTRTQWAPLSRTDSEFVSFAKQQILQRHADVIIVNVSIESTEATKEKIAVVVFRDGQTDFASVIDNAGVVVPSEEFFARDRDLRAARYGRLSPNLQAQLNEFIEKGEPIEVELVTPVVLSEPTLDSLPNERLVSIDEFDKWRERQVAQRVQLISAGKQAAKTWIIKQRGEIVQDLPAAPVILVRIMPDALRALDAQSGILQARLTEHLDTQLLGDYAGHASMNYSPPSGYLAGGGNCVGSCDGGLLTVGIFEGNSVASSTSTTIPALAKNNSRLGGYTGPFAVVYRISPTTCTTDTNCDPNVGTFNQDILSKATCQIVTAGSTQKYCVQAHPTYVAAAIGSSGTYAYDTLQPGGVVDPSPNVASGTSFVSSGAWKVRYRYDNQDGTTTANHYNFWFTSADGSPTAVYINRSAGPTSNDYDWALRTYGVLMTHAQGNDGASGVSACGLLRNILCIGSYNYNTHAAIGTHQISGFSSVGNPAVLTSLERPHLLGPGSHTEGSGLHVPRIDVAVGNSTMLWGEHWLPNDFNQVRGTSFSAPAVLGLAIQAHQYEGFFSALAYPVVNKAVMLASTVDIKDSAGNYDGRIGRSNVWFPQPADAADGGGQINANYTRQILDNNYYAYSDVVNNQFVSCGTGCREYVVGTIAVPAQQQVRVALAFPSCASLTTNPIIANDFDLVLTAPGNVFDPCTKFVASTSTNSEVEMVETTACLSAKTHTIRLRIKNGAQLASCLGFTNERVGLAWSLRTP